MKKLCVLALMLLLPASESMLRSQTVEVPALWAGNSVEMMLLTQDGVPAVAGPKRLPTPFSFGLTAPLSSENAFYNVQRGFRNTTVSKISSEGVLLWSVSAPGLEYLSWDAAVSPESEKLGYVTYRYNPDTSQVVFVSKSGGVSSISVPFRSYDIAFAKDGSFYLTRDTASGSRLYRYDSTGVVKQSREIQGWVRHLEWGGNGLLVVVRQGSQSHIELIAEDLGSQLWSSPAFVELGRLRNDGTNLWVVTRNSPDEGSGMVVLDRSDGHVVEERVLFDSTSYLYDFARMNDGSMWALGSSGQLRHCRVASGSGIECEDIVQFDTEVFWLAPLPFPVSYPDLDLDQVGEPFDNCPGNPNAGQEDWNADGSGDACQPEPRIGGVFENGGAVLEVDAVIQDPNDDPLAGQVSIQCDDYLADVSLAIFDVTADCLSGDYYHPHDISGEGIGFDGVAVADVRGLGCPPVYDQVYQSSIGTCLSPWEFNWRTDLPAGEVPPGPAYDVCIRKNNDHAVTVQVHVVHQDPGRLVFRPLDRSWNSRTDYSGVLPESVALTGLPIGDPTGRTCTLTLTTTDGTTPVVTTAMEFLYQGESTIHFGPIDPEVLLGDVLADIEAMGLDHGTSNALSAKLRAAQASLAAGNATAAANQLRAFTNLVEAQRGKRLTIAQADALAAAARNIGQFLG